MCDLLLDYNLVEDRSNVYISYKSFLLIRLLVIWMNLEYRNMIRDEKTLILLAY